MAELDIALLLLRLGAGLIFILHGWPKIKHMMSWGASIGVPKYLNPLSAICEFFGGIGILLGFATKLTALGPLFVMLGAIYYHKFKWGQPFVSSEKSYEYPVMLALVCVTLALLGAGAYSLDALFY